MSTRMQQRRGTAAQWISTNSGNGPILAAGEIGFESDTNKFKIGDGVNHWVDLTYFVDLESVLGGISGVDLPAALDTLNELAAALGDDPNYASTITTALGNKQDKVSGVSDTEIGYLDGVTSSIQTQLNSKLASTDLSEAAQDAVNTAIVAGTGLDKTYDDNGNTITLDIDSTVATKTYADTAVSTHSSDSTDVHGITDTAELATKAFAASLLTGATKSNITITGDKTGLVITAENGVADSTTDNLTEGSSNKYFTDERAQDAIGNSLGSGLSYNDSTGAISVNTSDIQARVSGVSDTEIGYLDGVTSAIQTQMDAKAPLNSPTFTGTVTLPANTISQSMMSDDSVGTNEIGGLAVTEEKIASSAVTEGKIADGAVTSAKIATGTIVNEDINASAAIAQSKIADLTTDLAAKAPIASPTFTGAVTLAQAPTSDLHAATKLYVDNVTAGINFHEAVHAASTTNLATNYDNGTGGVGATLTANTNRAFATLDGESVTLGQRVLIKDQTDAKQNGIYTLTTVGSGSTPWVLTRATDADNNPAGEMKNGDFCLVINGTVNASYGFINNSATNPIVIGTDNITYTQFNAGKTVVAGNGLQEVTPGTISIDTTVTQTRVSGVSDTEIGYLDGVTSGIQGQLDAKAPLASPTFTGTVTLPTGTVTSGMILDGTIVNGDIDSSAAIDWTKLAISSTVSATELGYVDGVTSAIQTQIDAKAPTANPTFTGTVSGITKSMVGLGNVENTALSTWAGTSSITTLGTVATGTWSANTIAINKGGTGATTAMAAATALLPSQTSNSGKYLTNDGAGTLSWSTVAGYSAPTLGSTSIASGATVTTITQLTLSEATLTGTLTAASSAGTSGQVLSSTGTGVQWTTPSAGAAFSELLLVGC